MDKHDYSLLVKISIIFLIFLALLLAANLFFAKKYILILILTTIIFYFSIIIFYDQYVKKMNQLSKIVTELKEENDSANKELNKAIFEIMALFEFTNILGGSNNNYQQMLNRMLDTIKRIIDYDGCCLLVVDESSQMFSVSICRGFSVEMNEKLKKISFEQYFVKEIFDSGEAIIIDDIQKETTRFTTVMTREIFKNLRSFVTIPLLIQNKLIGILTLGKNTIAGFTHEDLRLLFIIGSEAALAIQNKYLYEQVYYSSITDGLTGLFNHKYFREQIQDALQKAQTEHYKLSLALMDIDFFKNINDTYGHLEGDMVLKQISQIIKLSIPSEFLIARYGGEEFAILMPKIDSESAFEYSETVRSNIEDHLFITKQGTVFQITVSLGIASYPKNITNTERIIEELIDLADENLYRAKREGRNRVFL